MTKKEFQFFATLLKKRSGLTLTEDKSYLIESRLLPIARARNLKTIPQLYQLIRTAPSEALLMEVTEAMTTNESSFFRDIKPYEQLRNVVLPKLTEAIGPLKRLRIWSAACSTGQEPYSIAMCLLEDAVKMPEWSFDILATDLANKVINKARAGIYSQFEVQRGLPTFMLIKYFSCLSDTSWQIKDSVKSMLQFKLQNLLEDFSVHGKFDLVFCRNVLIYFDDNTKVTITEKMVHSLQPHGILILGATETLIDPNEHFTPMPELRGAYRLKK